MSTLYILDNKEYQCDFCLNKYAHRGDWEAMTSKDRQRKGCHDGYGMVINRVDVLGFKKCVGNYYAPEFLTWIEAYNQYEKGILPFPGSMMQQPNKAIEIFQAIGHYRRERDLANAKREKQKSKNKSRTVRRGR